MKMLMVGVMTCCMAACLSEAPRDKQELSSSSSVDGVTETLADGTAAKTSAIRGTWHYEVVPADKVPSEEALDGNSTGVTPLAQDCVFIQWCNQPMSSDGTVGRVRSSCFSQCTIPYPNAIINEFFGDAVFVCGSPLTNAVVLWCNNIKATFGP